VAQKRLFANDDDLLSNCGPQIPSEYAKCDKFGMVDLLWVTFTTNEQHVLVHRVPEDSQNGPRPVGNVRNI
jgi:hypothetical protein